MDIVKDKVANWFQYCKDYINNFTVVEKQKNLFYFAKFSLEISEFYTIFLFVKNVKRNIFTTLIEQLKYAVKDFLNFEDENLTMKSKVLLLYSACILIYYKKFCFNTDNTFEQYFDDDFKHTCKKTFKFTLANEEQFKVFVFFFYSTIQKEIKSLNYGEIKRLKRYYNWKTIVRKNREKMKGKRSEGNSNSSWKSMGGNDRSSDNKGDNNYIGINNTNKNNNTNDNNFNIPNNIYNAINNNSNISNNEIHNKNSINFTYNNSLSSSNLSESMNIEIPNENENINIYTNAQSNNKMIVENEEEDLLNLDNEEENGQPSTSYRIQDQVLTFLFGAKERIVDLVFECKYKGLFPNVCSAEIKHMNERLQQLNSKSAKEFQDLNNKSGCANVPKESNFKSNNLYNININNKISQNMTFQLSSNSAFRPMEPNKANTINQTQVQNNITLNKSQDDSIKEIYDIRNANLNPQYSNSKPMPLSTAPAMSNLSTESNLESPDTYSQRIISELAKNEVDQSIKTVIEKTAKIIDENYLDDILNKREKPVTIVKYFACYVLGFNGEMLGKINPEAKEVLKDYIIKFIVLSKDLYNKALELFLTIYDLCNTDVDTFVDLSRGSGIQVKDAQGLYQMFRDYSILLINEKNLDNMDSVFKKLFDWQLIKWEKALKQKGNEFTTVYKI